MKILSLFFLLFTTSLRANLEPIPLQAELFEKELTEKMHKEVPKEDHYFFYLMAAKKLLEYGYDHRSAGYLEKALSEKVPGENKTHVYVKLMGYYYKYNDRENCMRLSRELEAHQKESPKNVKGEHAKLQEYYTWWAGMIPL